MLKLESFSENIIRLAWAYFPKVAIALITLVLGFWLANHLSSWIKRVLLRNSTNPTIIPFLASTVSILMKVVVLLSVATKFGIETTSFVALLGTVGLAVGLSLQGNLSNFASGIMILIFKPYKVGDKITVNGNTGVVQEILVFNTVLRTADNKNIIIPNNSLTTAAVTNISGNGQLRVELNYKVSGQEDIDKVKAILLQVCSQNAQILQKPTPSVSVNTEDLNVSVFKVKVWTQFADSGSVEDYLNESIKRAFVAQGIQGPSIV